VLDFGKGRAGRRGKGAGCRDRGQIRLLTVYMLLYADVRVHVAQLAPCVHFRLHTLAHALRLHADCRPDLNLAFLSH